ALAATPVDAYGVGTALVTGSGSPTAGMVYKLVEVDGRPVAKRSQHKSSQPGRKQAMRRHKPSGTATEEVLRVGAAPTPETHDRLLQIPFMRAGRRVAALPTLEQAREHLSRQLITLPWEGLRLSAGEPAIGVTVQ
ncbi:MAG TPA: nicotinate phosphoribosyltransferase, partial [Mycobacteriales bacterium]|nr:nicotinate phosphoribosyltransferase [Mycobacteriales bacterium]